MPEVGRVDGYLGGDHDVLVVDRGLGVVALDRRLARRLDDARVGVGGIDLARRRLGRLVGVGRSRETPPVARPAATIGLVGLVRALFEEMLLLQPAL